MSAMLRVLWCLDIKHDDEGFQEVAEDGLYLHAGEGADKAPGSYGAGFGGEVVVCLVNEDNGNWFKQYVEDRGCKGRGCRHLPVAQV